MRKILTTLLFIPLAMTAQDELPTRDVTVEHEFKPVVMQAAKINTTPEQLPEKEVEEQKPSWSKHVGSMEAGKNVPALNSEMTHIAKESDNTHGELKGGLGHPQTLLDFRYTLSEKKNTMVLDLNHHGFWGDKLHEKTGLGVNYKHDYGTGNFYLDVRGGSEAFRYYGRQTEVEKFRDEIQNIWRFDLVAGARSNSKQDLQYEAQAEYRLFSRIGSAVEHQVNAQLNLSYRREAHRFGIRLRSQNQMYAVDQAVTSVAPYDTMPRNSRHALRIRPYYAWSNHRVRLSVGINLDMNIGKGEMNSVHNDDLRYQVAFAPSPDVHLEADLMPKKAIIYAKAEGSMGYSALPGYLGLNPYHHSGTTAYSHHASTYKPIIAEVGFRFRPIETLLVSVHAGYEYALNAAAYQMGANYGGGEFAKFLYTDYQRWKFGAQLDYHYRDIVDVHAWGDYYMYKGSKTYVGTDTIHDYFDRPDWELGMKIVGHIDQQWSVYTWGTFQGRRAGLVTNNDPLPGFPKYDIVVLPANIDLNVGVKYHFAGTGNKALDRLGLFLELRNIIHRKNMLWYGYESHGINGLAGVTWSF